MAFTQAGIVHVHLPRQSRQVQSQCATKQSCVLAASQRRVTVPMPPGVHTHVTGARTAGDWHVADCAAGIWPEDLDVSGRREQLLRGVQTFLTSTQRACAVHLLQT